VRVKKIIPLTLPLSHNAYGRSPWRQREREERKKKIKKKIERMS
jgi:hypothetical protein